MQDEFSSCFRFHLKPRPLDLARPLERPLATSVAVCRPLLAPRVEEGTRVEGAGTREGLGPEPLFLAVDGAVGAGFSTKDVSVVLVPVSSSQPCNRNGE